MKLKALSLYANVGIAETYFEKLGIEVVLANELIQNRCNFYKHLYPKSEMIQGDITKDDIKNEIIKKSKEYGVNFIIATPPCQGMSTAGKNDPLDPRNQLVAYAIDIIKKIKPEFVLLENVPQQLRTKIHHNNEQILVPNYIKNCLRNIYNFNNNSIINFKDIGVPQNRARSIFLLTKKKYPFSWEFPNTSKIITLKDTIGHLPKLDPMINDISENDFLKIFPKYYKRFDRALKISDKHRPTEHVYRQVFTMMYTPTGYSAFNNKNPNHRPKKKNGDFVKGFNNTYKRQSWDKPANTITTYNRTIGSQENVHPGRKLNLDKNGYQLYSDARVLTIYEIMLVMSLPENWNPPNWASDNLIRQVIGEGIPPEGMRKIIKSLLDEKI